MQTWAQLSACSQHLQSQVDAPIVRLRLHGGHLRWCGGWEQPGREERDPLVLGSAPGWHREVKGAAPATPGRPPGLQLGGPASLLLPGPSSQRPWEYLQYAIPFRGYYCKGLIASKVYQSSLVKKEPSMCSYQKEAGGGDRTSQGGADKVNLSPTRLCCLM
jgi:hypothetical protein